MSTPAAHSAPQPSEFRFGGRFLVDRVRRELRVDGAPMEVQPKVFDLLEYLIAHRERVVDKIELLEALWPDVVVTEASLTQALKKARRLLGDDGERQEVIRTVQRRGFRFVAELDEASSAASSAAAAAPDLRREPSVAVLAFADMSPERDQQHLCDGMAEEIMNALTRIEGLRVAARTSTFALKGTNADVREIGAKLGVDAVVEGSVRRAGDRLRVIAQLIDAQSGFCRWSERWDRSIEDVFAIQDEIAIRVAEALSHHLTSTELATLAIARPRAMSAYDFYLRGLSFRRQFGRRSQRFAIDMFSRALELDPNFAPAWAGLATSHTLLYSYSEASERHLSAAMEAGARAVRLDPLSAEAHVALGAAAALQHDGAAEQAFARAEALNPRLFDAWYLHGRSCAAQGRFARAAELYETAARVRSEDYEAPALAMQCYEALGRNDLADDAARRALAAAEHALALNPEEVRALSLCSRLWVRIGRPQTAREWVDRSLALEPDEPYVAYNAACTLVALGQQTLALDYLERIDLEAMANRAWMEHDASFEPIREEPRFRALLARAR